MAPTINHIIASLRRGLAQSSETSSLDAQVLVAHILERPRSWVLAHAETELDLTQLEAIDQALARLQQGEPLPYVIGHWEFYGLDFQLTRDVLIPRPETELLVERALAWLRKHPAATRVVDVGTGSGCIGIALAMHNPSIHVLMTDSSAQALQLAQLNADRFGLSNRLDFRQTDLLKAVDGMFDLLCANLPYIPTDTLNMLPVAKREPRLALNGGQSGVELITRLLDQATGHLSPGGVLLLEIEASQGLVVKSLAEERYPAAGVQIQKDLSGLDRCVEISLSRYIVHLCPQVEWQVAQKQGAFTDDSLLQAGFIHCSSPQQVLQVANYYYRETPDLMALWIDPGKLNAEIYWEATGESIFPHVYGPINLASVNAATGLTADADGFYHKLIPPA